MDKSFDKETYKIYTWKHWMILHFILNPGLAFNELILGQRVPKISLEDKTSEKPRAERSYVPCPHCNTLHDGRTWSTDNGTAFKNWFGLYCPECSGIIPCVMNVTSYLILALTFPLWGWFKDDLKKKWLDRQPERYVDLELGLDYQAFEHYNWIKTGLVYAAIMFILMTGLNYLTGTIEMTIYNITASALIWICGGFLFGFIMKLYLEKKGRKRTLQSE
jgi:hypothetical protein